MTIRDVAAAFIAAFVACQVNARFIQADPIGLRGGPNVFVYVGADPLSFIDPDGLAQIQVPKFATFAEEAAWRRKYKDLFTVNDSMREHMKKYCPQLLDQFDRWKVYVDPQIDDMLKRQRGRYASGKYSLQSTGFNKSFFNIDPGEHPSQGDVFAHEFRHMMKANDDLARAGDEARNPLTVPSEVDADDWALKFWRDCECRK
jgi:uncharacterized protein RhaS with RHS repeats